MSASGQSIGGNAIIRSPHTASRNMRHETIQDLAGRPLLRPVARLHGPECKNWPCTNLASMQTGNNLSPDLFASVVAGSHGEEMTSHLFTSRAALKLSQFAQTMLDVSVGLLIALFILLLFASPIIAAFCLLFLSFH